MELIEIYAFSNMSKLGQDKVLERIEGMIYPSGVEKFQDDTAIIKRDRDRLKRLAFGRKQ